MPVYKNKTGDYYVKYRVRDAVTGELKQKTKRGFKTKREATQWEAKERLERTAQSSATFWDIFQAQLDNNDTSPATRHKKEKWIEMYFADYKDVPIDKITKPQLVQWRNSLKESGLAARSMNCGMQYIKGVFSFYSEVYGGFNNASVLKPFKLPKKEMQIWTPAEFNQFIKAVDNYTLKAYYTFLYWTGCRRGEGLALTADCFTGNRCHIYRSVKLQKDGFKPLKTDSSERTITIDNETMTMIQPLIDSADPFVFGTLQPIAVTTVREKFNEAIERSGVKPIRLHDMRHSHASLLINNGVNIIAVSKRLGHATIEQTLKTYAHLMKDTEEEMIKTIENIRK